MIRKKPRKPQLLNVSETLRYVRTHVPTGKTYKFSKATLYRAMKKQKFPRPVKIINICYWRKKHIDAWLTKLVNGK